MSTASRPAEMSDPPEWVRCLVTLEPTATDRTRYEAGSVWAMPRARAEVLLERGDIELIDPPAVTFAAGPTPTPDEE